MPAFGGDPERVTLMGHGTGAALVNFIAVSPVAKGKDCFGLVFFALISSSKIDREIIKRKLLLDIFYLKFALSLANFIIF